MSPVFFSLGFAVVLAASAGAAPITVDAKKQLFLDDYLIESMTNVERHIQPAEKFGANPVLRATEPWENGILLLYGSVLREGDRYRMWYKCGPGVAYAESNDGIEWVKPRLDLVEIDGQKTNLLFRRDDGRLPYYYEAFGVLRDDREQEPSRRYKMGFLSIQRDYSGPREDVFHHGQRRGLGVAASPDGIHWKLVDSWATEAICDGLTTWTFDPARERYVLYGRTKKTLPEVEAAWSQYDWYKRWHWGRAVARAESPDFIHWDYTEPASAPVVMTADIHDEPGTEIYSMKVFPYESVYIGLVQAFLARPDAGYLELQLAVSHDGVNFTRVGDRAPFIPVGPVGSWDRFNQSPANNPPIAVGNEVRFYYGGRTYRHGPYAGPDKGRSGGAIGFASIKRDRFVALQASFDGGRIVTKPLKLMGRTLHLNAKSDFGEILVELLDDAGRPITKSKPIQCDALDIIVDWEDGNLPEGGAPVRLRITLKNARLFALWSV